MIIWVKMMTIDQYIDRVFEYAWHRYKALWAERQKAGLLNYAETCSANDTGLRISNMEKRLNKLITEQTQHTEAAQSLKQTLLSEPNMYNFIQDSCNPHSNPINAVFWQALELLNYDEKKNPSA